MKRILKRATAANDAGVAIVVFRDRCGRWNYCPAGVRHWGSFAIGDGTGGFDSAERALDAAKTDRSIPVGATITVEGLRRDPAPLRQGVDLGG